MSIETLFLIQFDLQPKYFVTVQDSTGGAVDITGATIRTSMRLDNSTALTINRSTAGITLTASSIGQFEYAWQAGDTDSTGLFSIEFEVTPSAGGKFTLPNPMPTSNAGTAHVTIRAGLDST